MYRRIILGCEVYILIAAPLMFQWFWSGKDIRPRRPHTFLAFAEDLLSGWSDTGSEEKLPFLNILYLLWSPVGSVLLSCKLYFWVSL